MRGRAHCLELPQAAPYLGARVAGSFQQSPVIQDDNHLLLVDRIQVMVTSPAQNFRHIGRTPFRGPPDALDVDEGPCLWRRYQGQLSTTNGGVAMLQRREEFQHRIEELVARFESEIDRHEWVTRRYPKRLRDDDRQVYE